MSTGNVHVSTLVPIYSSLEDRRQIFQVSVTQQRSSLFGRRPNLFQISASSKPQPFILSKLILSEAAFQLVKVLVKSPRHLDYIFEMLVS